MALTNLEIYWNAQIAQEIIDEKFKHVENKEALKKALLTFLETNSLYLQKYTGFYRTLINDAINSMLVGNGKEFKPVKRRFNLLLAQIRKEEASEHKRYNQQEKEPNIIGQLKQYGYVKPNHLFTDEDMKHLFSYLHEQNEISCTDPISVTDDNGDTLSQALADNKKPGKLLIPANLYNGHWVLLIRDQDKNNKVTLRCWNSLSKPEKELPIKGILEGALGRAYNSTMGIVESVYTGEQEDNVSCGPRVAQEAYRLAGIKNDLTKVPVNNSSILCYQAIAQIAKKDDALAAHKLKTVAQEVGQLVYSKENYNKDDRLKGIVDEAKNYQETLDENLAIELQDVYNKNPNISPKDAFDLAKLQQKADYEDGSFDKKKLEVVNWATIYFNEKKYLPSNFARKQEAKKADDDNFQHNSP